MSSNLKAFDAQIAGHTEETPGSENIPRFLQSDNGFVFKPVTGKRGKREVEFYELSETYDISFRQYLAAFDKVIKYGSHEYMGIEDLTYPYEKDHVNVADIKMGTRTYDASATEEKIRLEIAKASKTTTASLGIRFCGAKLVRPDNGEHLKFDKDWGKALTKDNILHDGLVKLFSCGGDHLFKDIVEAYLVKLRALLVWFQNNRSMAFYSSSLLFVFGRVNASHKAHHNVTMISEHHGISLKMIDFAHVDPLDNKAKDQSYIIGLENLISLMEQLLKL
ncbi:hypothetical protein PPL_10630 [Heterostelium album PN500]|uniref:Kinase n=1 Tax=Heterostelium pallidum (strain ATCC 26659 / Pp 5 / PN500) TaxID=670386 RepID=D3BRL9_HETP5|nr:hypothetical protein PPL_10630 [Heterostelium album PN500]EFA76051.1 hypothetical protein PPL_10630 [Heterostelium album PN500]|eukprot:XP_020428185.1 hypothetical protein PPL_10630 [Heterostelium album PN500]